MTNQEQVQQLRQRLFEMAVNRDKARVERAKTLAPYRNLAISVIVTTMKSAPSEIAFEAAKYVLEETESRYPDASEEIAIENQIEGLLSQEGQ
mgnify:CR=1 FL=1